jgi:hypothetical protein
MQINQLTTVDSFSGGDQIVFFSTNNGSTRRISVTDLAKYVNSTASAGVREQAQSYAPAIAGTSVTVLPTTNGNNKWLKILPASGAVTSLTVNLPLSTTLSDGQEVLVTSNLAIATLTVGSNGADAVLGAPTSLPNNGYFKLRYDMVTRSWYRIG